LNFDLHCHSSVSDGLLAPRDVVARAAANGVTTLALTDHDEISGLADAREAAGALGIAFVNGVEISISWRETTIHIVGLRVDPANPVLLQGLESTRTGRTERAKKMADRLEASGIRGSFEGASAYAENPNLISRTHFARFLVENGYAKDIPAVFRNYLVAGKPGYVAHEWASVADAVHWIHAAGGIAVVAHPGRYKLKRPALRAFLAEFRDMGGQGIEVITGSHTAHQYGEFAIIAREYGFLSSRGSDFHGPGESHTELGRLPQLPEDLKPVWHDW
jgi:predicted metal-dependent phosphoesterase TrpH